MGGEKGLGGVGGREGADLSSPCLPVLRSRGRRLVNSNGQWALRAGPFRAAASRQASACHVRRCVSAGEPQNSMIIEKIYCSNMTVGCGNLTDQTRVIKWLRNVRKIAKYEQENLVTLKSGA